MQLLMVRSQFLYNSRVVKALTEEMRDPGSGVGTNIATTAAAADHVTAIGTAAPGTALCIQAAPCTGLPMPLAQDISFPELEGT